MEHKQKHHYPNILTIAGSDSGGGAGVQADLKTITALGGFGLSVITALTAQNGAEVRGVLPTSPDFVALQYATVTEGFPITAAKTGMLSSAAIIRTVSSCLQKKSFPLVVDPVCVSQSGFKLLEDDALSALRELIIPYSDLLTPNLPETEALSGITVKTEQDIALAASKFFTMGAKAVLIKGGHFALGEAGNEAEYLTDWFCLPGRAPKGLRHQRVDTGNNHGTGCTLSAAIATFLGLGFGMEESIIQAQNFLQNALAASYTTGIGAGPPNFMAAFAEDFISK